jgi:hypothetical protein
MTIDDGATTSSGLMMINNDENNICPMAAVNVAVVSQGGTRVAVNHYSRDDTEENSGGPS